MSGSYDSVSSYGGSMLQLEYLTSDPLISNNSQGTEFGYASETIQIDPDRIVFYSCHTIHIQEPAGAYSKST